MIDDAGGRTSVVAIADAHDSEARASLGGVPLLTARHAGPRVLGYSPQIAGMVDRLDADILHLHGIWTDLSRVAARWARRTGKPYVISPHGMLDPWIIARGRWKKALARWGYERASWARASAFHALTEDEAADIRREAGARRIWIIPNAGPPAAASSFGRPAVVAYLGRIHPKKNLGALVEAWRKATLPEGAELKIAGWGDAADVSALQADINGIPSIQFLGPLQGVAKQDLLEEAGFLVLPSHSEGLPMAVLEAWAAGAPTIMTAACHLPEGFATGAAIECGTDVPSIAEALVRALQEPDWSKRSQAALALARGPFSPDTIRERWVEAYGSLAGDKCK